MSTDGMQFLRVSENYADKVASEVYRSLDERIRENMKEVYGFVIDLDKRTALNAQGLAYENQITNNKIDCCCDKMNIKFEYENRLRDLADASIISYVNSTFLPGTLKLPITSICPQPATPTTTAQVITMVSVVQFPFFNAYSNAIYNIRGCYFSPVMM